MFSLDLVKEIDPNTGTLICEFVHVSVLTKTYIENKRACILEGLNVVPPILSQFNFFLNYSLMLGRNVYFHCFKT